MNYMLWAGEFLLFSHVIYVEATIAGVVINGYHDLAGWKVRLYAHWELSIRYSSQVLAFLSWSVNACSREALADTS